MIQKAIVIAQKGSKIIFATEPPIPIKTQQYIKNVVFSRFLRAKIRVFSRFLAKNPTLCIKCCLTEYQGFTMKPMDKLKRKFTEESVHYQKIQRFYHKIYAS